jgi:hypothetical protein
MIHTYANVCIYIYTYIQTYIYMRVRMFLGFLQILCLIHFEETWAPETWDG